MLVSGQGKSCEDLDERELDSVARSGRGLFGKERRQFVGPLVESASFEMCSPVSSCSSQKYCEIRNVYEDDYDSDSRAVKLGVYRRWSELSEIWYCGIDERKLGGFFEPREVEEVRRCECGEVRKAKLSGWG